MHRPHVYSGGRYPVLRALAIIYLVGALLAIIAGAYAIWWALARFNDAADRLVLVSGACAATFLLVVSMLAIAEVLKLFIDVEHNTRMAAMRATGQIAPTAAATSGNGGKVGGRLVELEEINQETAEEALIRGH
jgi:MFS family permease